MSNIPSIVLGSTLIIWGIEICFHPVYYSSKFGRTFDFTGINIPYGLFVAAVGVLFLWSSFRKK